MKYLMTLGLSFMLLSLLTAQTYADDINGIVQTPTVSQVLGSVKVFRKKRFERVYRGMKLQTGDEIRTGRRGRVYIDFPDNSRVKLGNRSRFLVRNWGKDEAGVFTSTLHLFQGVFRYTADLLTTGYSKRNTTISTRTAVIGVRGTDFWGRIDKNKTFFLLLEGEVTLTPQYGETIIYNEVGKAVSINHSNISEPETLTTHQIAPLAAETEIQDY